MNRSQQQERIAILFPGQGSQSVGMLKSLREAWPEFDAALRRLAPLFSVPDGNSVLAMVDAPNSEAAETLLMQTEHAQPALGLFEAALFQAMKSWGLAFDACAGHSFGELTALYAAGFYDVETLARLSRKRGELLRDAGSKLPGRMLAVQADISVVTAQLKNFAGHIELANVNSREQVVVGGSEQAIEQLQMMAKEFGVRCVRLKTSCAFHTSLMKPAVELWSRDLSEILAAGFAKNEERRPTVYSNLKALPYETGIENAIESLSLHLISPVLWLDSVERMYADGVRVFLELGPGQVLSKLGRSILKGKDDAIFISMDPGNQDATAHLVSVKERLFGAEDESRTTPAEEAIPAKSDILPKVDMDLLAKGNLDVVQRYLEVSESVTIKLATELSLAERERVLERYLASTEAVMHTFLGQKLGPVVASGALASSPDPAAAASANSNVETNPVAWLKSRLAKATGLAVHQIDEGMAFDRFGIDSISLMENLADLLEAFPYLAEKKAQLYTIRSLKDLGAFAPEEKAKGKEDPVGWLKKRMATVTGLKADEIVENRNFDAFGIDSISMMECMSDMLEHFPELQTQKAKLYGLKNLNDLRALNVQTGSATPGSSEKSKKERTSLPVQTDFHPLVNKILSEVVLSFAAATGKKLDDFSLTAHFEKDLRLDSFTRQEAIDDALAAYPRYAFANQALLKANSLQEIGRLLDRFDDPRALVTDPSVSKDAASRSIQRYVLRKVKSLPLQEARSIEFPESILLIGESSQYLRNLKRAFSNLGCSVQILILSQEHWALEGSEIQIARKDSEALAKLLGSLPLPTDLAIFTVNGDDQVLLTNDPGGWKKQLDRGPIALFELMKAIRALDPGKSFKHLGLLGHERGTAAWNAARGCLKSFSRESPEMVCTSICLEDIVGRIARQRILKAFVVYQGQHDIFISNADVSLRILKKSDDDGADGNYPALPEGALVLATGGASGITAAFALELLKVYPKIRIAAIGRTAYTGQGESERGRAIQKTEAAIRAAGGSFIYLQADAADEAQMEGALDRLIAEHGPVHALIHGAGMSDDSLVARKSFASFEKVLASKTQSLPMLFAKLKDQPLCFVVLVSSLSAVNGAPGQTDYAAANEALNAAAEIWKAQLPCKVLAMLWSVWGEIGLAGDAFVERMKSVGLDPIAPAEGLKAFLEVIHADNQDSWVLLSPFSTLEYSLRQEKETFKVPKGA